MPHNQISAQESPVPLPKFQMAPRFKILMFSQPKKRTQIYYPFQPRSSGKRIHSRFPRGPYGERYLLTWYFYISLDTSLFIFPSESPVREPPPYSLTESLWKGILCHQNHFIHSFMYVCQSPQKGALLHMGKNIRSPSMEPYAVGRPTYNGVRPGSPRGLLMKPLSLTQCHAAFSTIPSTLAWVDQSPIS